MYVGAVTGAGTAVGICVGLGAGVRVGSDTGVGKGVPVGSDAGVGRGVPVGSRVGVGVCKGVGVGTGVRVGLGVKVGCGVNVGSGVFKSMRGGWSPSSGDSIVGGRSKKPGSGSGSTAGVPQASATDKISVPTTNVRRVEVIPGRPLRKCTSRLLFTGLTARNGKHTIYWMTSPGITCLSLSHPASRFAPPRRRVPALSRSPTCPGCRI